MDGWMDGCKIHLNKFAQQTKNFVLTKLMFYSSSSVNGARPKVEYSTDSTYKAREVGASGIPHTSYSQSGSSYSTENPYKNRVSSFSYNI